MTDTIFALATSAMPAGVAVIRISGPDSLTILEKLTLLPPPQERLMALRKIWSDAEVIDEGLAVWFGAGRSYTGEDVVELQIHGGRATVDGVMNAIGVVGGRLAEPGEFTRRALENGRLDLTQAEALADLIDAETTAQRRQAAAALSGTLSEEIEGWRDRIIRCLALLEASIDFADEDDAPEDVSEIVASEMKALRASLAMALDGFSVGERVRDGFTVALVGPPNVGKSSLVNRLAQREVSIVSPFPGTTRDVMEVRCEIEGLPVTFLDLAGLRDASDPVERIGVERARERAAAADLRLFLRSVDTGEPEVPIEAKRLDFEVCLKSDLGTVGTEIAASSSTGEGLDALASKIAESLRPVSSVSALISNRRQKEHVERALSLINPEQLESGGEIAAFELRQAAAELDLLVGAISTEQVLDEVFSRFCMGK